MATYRYLRWKITETYHDVDSTGAYDDMCSLADFEVRASGASVTWPVGTSATNPGGSNPGGEEPAQLLDNDSGTKFVDTSQAFPCELKFDCGASQSVTFDAYRYRTVNSTAERWRDPVSWTLEGSDNNTDWTLLDTRTRATIPTAAATWTADFSLPGAGGIVPDPFTHLRSILVR